MLEQLLLLVVVVDGDDEAEIQRERTRPRGFCDAISGAACACRGIILGHDIPISIENFRQDQHNIKNGVCRRFSK
jgi:hypothetical protein